ncbi:MAG: DUF167 domain-containing protein [Chitinophagaceae bacterium]|nr:DUF167 domain-containing protein [Chitinophagaceae bacterium]
MAKKQEDDSWKKLVTDKMEVTVTPKASFNKIKAEITGNALHLKIYVTAAPEDGKANKAVIELLAKELGLAKSSILIIGGTHSRKKLIKISQ